MMFQDRSVGIDIQETSVKIAVATLQGGRVKVLDLIEEEIIEPEEVDLGSGAASAVRRAVQAHGLDGGTCVTSLPASCSISRVLTTPLTDLAKIRQTLKFQIETQIPYPIDQVISDYLTIRKVDEGTEILAIAVTKEPISESLKVMQEAGVEPQILTLDALVLADFYRNDIDFSPDKATALLVADSNNTFLGIFVGEKLVGYRNLDGAPSNDPDAISAVVKELRRTLVTFQTSVSDEAEIGALCVAGQSSNALWLALQESFPDLPVRTVEFNEMAIADMPSENSEDIEGFQLAIALANAGLEASANPVNFRREEYAPASIIAGLKRTMIVTGLIFAVMLVAWFGSVLAQVHSQTNRIESLNEEMLQIFTETMPGIKSPKAAEQKIREEQEKFKSLGNYSAEYVSPLEVMSEILKNVPDKKNLTLTLFSISDGVLRISGEADSFEDVNIFGKNLENSPLFHGVDPGPAETKKGNKVTFRINAKIKRESSPASGEKK